VFDPMVIRLFSVYSCLELSHPRVFPDWCHEIKRLSANVNERHDGAWENVCYVHATKYWCLHL